MVISEFEVVRPLLGGALIGAGASVLLALNGRVAGISGIAVGALEGGEGGRGWRACFLAGLLAGPLVYWLLAGGPPALLPDRLSPALVVGGGLLVGFGTRLGSGCTSGHGVCGLARLSVRSLVATFTFVGVGMATVLLVRHGLGFAP